MGAETSGIQMGTSDMSDICTNDAIYMPVIHGMALLYMQQEIEIP